MCNCGYNKPPLVLNQSMHGVKYRRCRIKLISLFFFPQLSILYFPTVNTTVWPRRLQFAGWIAACLLVGKLCYVCWWSLYLAVEIVESVWTNEYSWRTVCQMESDWRLTFETRSVVDGISVICVMDVCEPTRQLLVPSVSRRGYRQVALLLLVLF